LTVVFQGDEDFLSTKAGLNGARLSVLSKHAHPREGGNLISQRFPTRRGCITFSDGLKPWS
jgi:hypothetical protein